MVILIVVPAFAGALPVAGQPCPRTATVSVGPTSSSGRFFAAYAIYMWWRFLHEASPEGSPGDAAAADPGGPDAAAASAVGGPETPEEMRKTPTWRPTTTIWRSWRNGTRPAAAEASGSGQSLCALHRVSCSCSVEWRPVRTAGSR